MWLTQRLRMPCSGLTPAGTAPRRWLNRAWSFVRGCLAHSRTEIVSWEIVHTIIVGLQAVQAFYVLGASLFMPVPGPSNYFFRVALDKMFLSIGLLCLYRFCAGLWISDH